MKLTPQQALQNLHGIAEQVSMNGESRDVARECTRVLEAALAERDRLLTEKEAAKPEKAKKA